jgi:hypothetical protein
MAVEINYFKVIGIRDVERTDAQAGQGGKVNAANAPHADDGDAAVAEPRMFRAGK